MVIGDEVVGAMERTAPDGDFRANLHWEVLGKKLFLRIKKNNCCKSCKKLGLSVAGVDLIRSNRGLLVIEVNSSPGLEGIEATTRKDIAAKIIKYIESKIK
ncbi:MAG: hypothetical protein CM15mP42_12160 [Methanobacteriota archaeon]|nr:MAG: hypothetical protein CM15mP42_12160 [Euryarchaeota archaeon]